MTRRRFRGTVAYLTDVDVTGLIRWVSGIPFDEWHQQRPLDDGLLRPAMMTDLAWHGFGDMARPVVEDVMRVLPDCETHQWMLSVVMPGHAIEKHRDSQSPDWFCRVHVPLTSNERSQFIVGGVQYYMAIGHAYMVNTEAEHEVQNNGSVPRIHFMFDVRNKNP